MSGQARFNSVIWILLGVFAFTPSAVFAQQDQVQPEAAQPKPEAAQTQAEKDKVISGMSILGNQEAPKSLVIVPWKSSEIGDSMGISTMLDDSRQPIDKEVFMRMLSYYEVRSNITHQDSAPAGGGNTAAAKKSNAAKPVAAAQRRK